MMIGRFDFEPVIPWPQIRISGDTFASGFTPSGLGASSGKAVAKSSALWVHESICRIMELDYFCAPRPQSASQGGNSHFGVPVLYLRPPPAPVRTDQLPSNNPIIGNHLFQHHRRRDRVNRELPWVNHHYSLSRRKPEPAIARFPS